MPGRQEYARAILGLLDIFEAKRRFGLMVQGLAKSYSPDIAQHGGPLRTDYDLPHRFVLISSLVIYMARLTHIGLDCSW